MISDRQLWGIGGLSVVGTLVVLLGASGRGDIARAAAAAFGGSGSPTTQAAAATTPATGGDAAASDGAAAVAADASDLAGAGTASGTTDAAGPTDDGGQTDGGSSSDAGTTDGAAATTPGRTPSKIKHVFVVELAGQGSGVAFGAGSLATYLNGALRPKGVLLTGFSSLGTSGIADRIALVSGQPPNAATKAGCTTYSQIPPLTAPDANGLITQDGCTYPSTIVTVAEQLSGKRLTWKGYAEDLDQGPRGAAATCRRPDPDKPDDTQSPRPGDTYAARNVPWVYFRSLIDVAACDTGVVPLSRLKSDLAATATTPNLTYVSPGLCSDGSEPADACASGNPGGLAAADAFLQQIVPPILASPAYQQDGLLVITFAGAPGTDGAPAKNGALLLSRFLPAGGTVGTAYDPYSLLRTIEDIFALPKYLAKAADATSFADDVLASARPVQAGDD